MNAKQAFAKTRPVNESPGDSSSDLPAGNTNSNPDGGRIPRKRAPGGVMPPEPPMPEGKGGMGGQGGAGGGGRERTTLLMGVLLLMTTELMGNDFDGPIARKLIDGKQLDQSEISHILTEASRIQNLPEAHQRLLKELSKTIG